MADGDAATEHEIAARAIGREDRVVLHVGPRADDDAAVTGADGTAEEDARVVGDLDVAGDDRRWRDVGAATVANGRAMRAAVRRCCGSAARRRPKREARRRELRRRSPARSECA